MQRQLNLDINPSRQLGAPRNEKVEKWKPQLTAYQSQSDDIVLRDINGQPIIFPVHLFGTDSQGRDVFIRTLVSTRVYLLPSLMAIGLSVFFGTLLGILGADIWTGQLMKMLRFFAQFLLDVLEALPKYITILLAVILIPPEHRHFQWHGINWYGFYWLSLILGWVSVPKLGKLIMERIDLLKKREFIEAAEAMGMSKFEVAFKHVLRYNCLPLFLTQAAVLMTDVILTEIVLSYLTDGTEWGRGITVAETQSELGQHFGQRQILSIRQLVAELLSFADRSDVDHSQLYVRSWGESNLRSTKGFDRTIEGMEEGKEGRKGRREGRKRWLDCWVVRWLGSLTNHPTTEPPNHLLTFHVSRFTLHEFEMSDPILAVKNLKTYIHDKRRKRLLRIVDDVSFEVKASEAIGIFGESGSGKSSVAHSIMGLMPEKPGIVDGEIWLLGQNLLEGIKEVCPPPDTTKPGQVVLKKEVKGWKKEYEERMKRVRGVQIALMPQGAKTALWPFGTIEQQIRKAYLSGSGQQQDADPLVKEILEMLKLNEMANQYPHQLSGGACQRAIIGMTLALAPTIIIADEPTTGLDTTLQVKIVELLQHFKDGTLPLQLTSGENNKQHALILISHDLRLMKKVADGIVVMYAGEVVESGDSSLIRDGNAAHPYTQRLLKIDDISVDNTPNNASNARELDFISGEVPTLLEPPQGCKFYSRCHHPDRNDQCRTERPELLVIDSTSGHQVRCHVVTNTRKSDPLASRP
ncbi:dipeptide/oligopeptide/nickel ABC transporter permease/ATP-binding protein [Candidatus Poribacteria bacterium]|nr:dipeptide/oligopeptide/nickel ABC transporter permease/ATP-binding protein [Candidatus Poribacteria bacterium]